METMNKEVKEMRIQLVPLMLNCLTSELLPTLRHRTAMNTTEIWKQAEMVAAKKTVKTVLCLEETTEVAKVVERRHARSVEGKFSII
jgi:hypothetical protein